MKKSTGIVKKISNYNMINGFNPLNPFDLATMIFLTIKNIAADILGLVLGIWMLSGKFLWLWLFVVIFIPGMNWLDHVYMLVEQLVIYPTTIGIESFAAFGDYYIALEKANADNPLRSFYHLGMRAICAVGLLGTPIVFFMGWIFVMFIAFMMSMSKKLQAGVFGMISSIPAHDPATNLIHVFGGNMTLKEAYQMEAQANVIAESLKKN